MVKLLDAPTTNEPKVKIKLCGMRRMQDIEYANRYKPNYIGYVFANSKRQVTDTMAKQLTKALDSNIIPIGVFVNDTIEHIAALCEQNIISAIQLHGDEDIPYINRLQKLTDKPIIKAVRVQDTSQLMNYKNFPSNYLLLDTYIKNTYGGSGQCFDWSLIPDNFRNFFLAGGLNLKNITKAVKECQPYCIDLSSAIETDGYKDEAKIKAVMNVINHINNHN